MTYAEFKATYKAALKKYPDMSTFFGKEDDKIGTMTITYYRKSGSRWVETKTETEEITARFYMNTFDPGWAAFAGSERNYTTYTRFGKLPYKNVSISPDFTEKVTRVATF